MGVRTVPRATLRQWPIPYPDTVSRLGPIVVAEDVAIRETGGDCRFTNNKCSGYWRHILA
jgi:hypothetical protein